MTVETVELSASPLQRFFDGRPDLLLHALAQLPDEFEAEFGERPRGSLPLLVRAYGLEHRVRFGRSTRTRSPSLLRSGSVVTTAGSVSTMAELVETVVAPHDPATSTYGRGELLRGERIVVVTNIPAPYRIPLFNGVAQRLADAGAEFRVIFLAVSPRGRSWMRADLDRRFSYDVLQSVELPIGERRPLAPIDLARKLEAFRPTLLLSGGFSPLVSARVALYAAQHEIPFGIWSGEIAGTATASSRLRTAQRRLLIRRLSFAVAYGYAAGEYLRALRPDVPFVYGRNTSNTAAAGPVRARRNRAVELLAIGDLSSSRKGIDVVVDALRLEPRLRCRLRIVGGGALLSRLARSAAGDDRIEFLGPLPQGAVAECLRDADVLLFPSREDVFGLALVEAMDAGLAVVSSTNPGAVGDLAVHGHNAWLVEGHAPGNWAKAIAQVVGDDDLRLALGEAARRTIRRRWTIDHSVDAMIAGFRLGALTREVA